MDNQHLRAIILKLQDRLSNDDRKRLHFYLGNDVPRRIRDDPSLSGTLNLMDSLFDQDKINEQDFTLLINAFDEIRCIDAVKLLTEHLRQNQLNGLNKSMESLSLIMPPMLDQLLQDQEEDKLITKQLLVNQRNTYDDNNLMITSNNTDINRIPMIVNDQEILYLGSKRKQILNLLSTFWPCLLLFVLLSIIGYGIIIFFSIGNNNRIEQLKHLFQQIQEKKTSTFKSNIHHNTRWMQNGFTVAGGNGKGSQLNQLQLPYSIYVDDNQTIYVADYGNNRIVEWRCGATNGQIVAGGSEKGNRTNQLNRPTDLTVDKERDDLIICDYGNRRIMRWPRQYGINGQIMIANIDCNGLIMDNNGYLYVSDYRRDEVRRWKINDTYGTLVAGGNGKGNHLNQLDNPTFIFIGEDHSIYVSDWNNDRVMKWVEGVQEGTVVVGGQSEGDTLSQLPGPHGLIVDRLGTIYVADCNKHRIMRWFKGDSTKGNIVIGGNGMGERANQLNCPEGLSFDQRGNLYVVDSSNSRVQRFNIDRCWKR